MADKIKFPKTMKEFIDSYSFKDEEQIYTNGAELIPVFRVEQALEHYEKAILNKAIDDLVTKCKQNTNDMFGQKYVDVRVLDTLAEQLKGGGK